MLTSLDHTFSVCAYGNSPYLEECVQSLLSQTIPSRVVIATSTPTDHIRELGKKYNIPVYVNKKSDGITSDWNFACKCAKTSLLTIAHQDDVYLPTYLDHILAAINSFDKPLIAFSAYAEIEENEVRTISPMLKIKRGMLKALTNKKLSCKTSIKRASISLGNPICCPSVTYVRSNLPETLFKGGFRSNLDWDAWERFSRLSGSFVYVKSVEMYHRIHEESETSMCIKDNVRLEEDLELLMRFWPKRIAKIINSFYSKAQKFN